MLIFEGFWNVILDTGINCPPGYTSCNDERQCYSSLQERCDGRASCGDNSDEWGCG